jgi:hypothetical protein
VRINGKLQPATVDGGINSPVRVLVLRLHEMKELQNNMEEKVYTNHFRICHHTGNIIKILLHSRNNPLKGVASLAHSVEGVVKPHTKKLAVDCYGLRKKLATSLGSKFHQNPIRYRSMSTPK